MVCVDCCFNPLKDISEVDPFGFIDLTDALSTGIVTGNSVQSSSFDGEIEDTALVGRRVKNVFDAMDNIQYISDNTAITE